MTSFVLVGANGYIGKRHAEAIKAIGGELLAIVDPHDCAGWLDGLGFYDCDLIPAHLSEHTFTHVDWPNPDYVVILTPNKSHFHHAKLALIAGCHVIVEKPACLSAKHCHKLEKHTKRIENKVTTILQLRHQDGARDARAAVEQALAEGKHLPEAIITYHAHRGRWYQKSWKGDPKRSGGLIFNIGSHPVDLACWMFGKPTDEPGVLDHDFPDHLTVTGMFGRTRVEIRLSSRTEPITREIEIPGLGTWDLSENFGNLHAECYREILAGNGPTPADVVDGIEWCAKVAKEVER